jgi:hypothetical protein
MPRRVRKLLDQIGNNLIVRIQLGRTPVEAILILFLNFVSAGKFADKTLELGYDEIYHNYLLITIQRATSSSVVQTLFESVDDSLRYRTVKLDKAHRVRLMDPIFPTEFVDVYDIPLTLNKNYTLNRLITVASNVDKHFYSYDAANNNMCQTFVENIIDINGLTGNIINHTVRMALKPQNARMLVATLGSRRDLVKIVTDLGGKLDQFIFDRKITWKKPLKKAFTIIGNMHVKVISDSMRNSSKNILMNSEETVFVDGMDNTIMENTDDVFNAVVSLEQSETHFSSLPIIGSISVVLLVISTVTIIVYIIQRQRQRQQQ